MLKAIERQLTKSIQCLKIKVNLTFSGSLMSKTGNLGCACAHIFQKRTWGALIGTSALNRVNTIGCIMIKKCFNRKKCCLTLLHQYKVKTKQNKTQTAFKNKLNFELEK